MKKRVLNRKEFWVSLFPLFAALVWGLGFVAQVSGSESIQPFSFNAIRNVVGLVALIPAVLFLEQNRDRLPVRTIVPAIACGVILFAAQSLQQIGLGLTSSSAKGGFLTSLYAILVPFIEFFIYGKRFKTVLWVSVILSFAGLFLIFAGGSDSSSLLGISTGDWVLLANSVLYAVHIIAIDRCIDRVRPFLFSAIQVATVAVLSGVVALVIETPDIDAVRNAAIPILYGGLASTAIGYTMQVLAQKNRNVILTSIMFSTESMFAAVGGFIILHERLAALAVLGCVMIFISVIFAQIVSNRAG